MKIVHTIDEIRAVARGEVGLVPTMGALHEGHVALFGAARAENGLLVASVFVNPAQFDEPRDFEAYSRDEARDEQTAAEAGVDVLFVPAADEIYPPGYATWVDVDVSGGEAIARPGHFRGVATVCLKLFNIVRPRRAYFGQKDAQQAAVVRRLVHDLDLEVEIRVHPTIRDADGLAFSSRNARLSADERARALDLPRALHAGADAYASGADPVAAARAALNGLTPDYVELLELDGALLLAAAVRVGPTRLIDNVLLKGELE
jgi:pantoate--beta-alanine ligase